MKQTESIGDRIKILLNEQNMTQRELAKRIDVTEVTIGRYVNNERIPKSSTIADIGTALGVSTDYLLGNSVREQHETYHTERSPTKKVIKVPVVGRIAAGIPIAAIENIEDFEDVIVPAHAVVSDYFCLKVSGDSMLPRIQDGDIVVFQKASDVDNGEVAAVLVNGEDATIKQVRKNDTGIVLMPYNPAYEPKFYTFQEVSELPVTILGKAVQLLGKFNL